MTRILPILSCLLAACGGVAFTELPAPPRDDGGSLDGAAPGVEAAWDEDAGAEASRDSSPSTHPDGHVTPHQDAAPDAPASDAPSASDRLEPADAGAEGCAAVTHVDGLGQSWEDCAPLATYSLAEASAACAAGYGSALSCSPHVCGTGQPGDPLSHAVCGSVVCWAYDGAFGGMVTLPASGGCPRAGAMMAPWQ